MTDQPRRESEWAQAWIDELEQVDQCPWAGPRPLEADEHHWLVGRDDDTEAIVGEIVNHSLVILAGLSGSGKSSLISGGLVPRLNKIGRTTIVCRDWAQTRTGREDGPQDDVNAFLEPIIRDQLPDDLAGDNLRRKYKNIVEMLDEQLGSRCVIVLDQFEELIRDAPVFKDQLFGWIEDVTRRTNSIRIVISLRTEYLHELRSLERRLTPFTTSTVLLQDVSRDCAGDIIRSHRARSAPGSVIDGAVAQAVETLWKEAADDSGVSSEGRIGLIHLQGMLYVLHDLATRGPDGMTPTESPITKQDLASLREKADDPDEPRSVCHAALQEAVHVKLNRCRRAAKGDGVGIDTFLLEGSTEAVRRIAPHLSSGGYKLIRTTPDLFLASGGELLADLLEQCGLDRTRNDQAAFLSVVVGQLLGNDEPSPDSAGVRGHPLTLDRETVKKRIEAKVRKRGIEFESPEAPEADEKPSAKLDRSAGPMRGSPALDVLIEEARRFALAMLWMKQTALLRISNTGGVESKASLIHDRFGEALLSWSRQRSERSSSGPVYALAEIRGANLDWRTEEDDSDAEQSEASIREFGPDAGGPLVNLIWPACFIRASFKNTVFVNCDFRGSFFDNCRFEGVTFANCLLDGAMFSNCEIIGAPPRISRGGELTRDKAFPSKYWISNSRSAAVHLNTYNPEPDVDIADDDLYVVAGIPESKAEISQGTHTDAEGQRTYLGSGSREHDVAIDVSGSLLILGGRIASLTVANPLFPDGEGFFCLWETAGSGFNVTRQHGAGRFDIRNSALRHLSFTAGDTAPTTAAARIELRISDSAIHQIWCDDRLRGEIACTGSQLLHFWRGNLDMNAELIAKSNVLFEGTPTDELDYTELTASDRDKLIERAGRIDGIGEKNRAPNGNASTEQAVAP